MPGLAFPSTQAPPTVRRPTFELSFGGAGGGSDGGLLGSVAAALGVGAGAADAWKDSVVSVCVQAGLAPAVDLATVELAAESRAPKVALGDSGKIALGYADAAAEPVFAGAVVALQRSAGHALRLQAGNAGSLPRLRLNQGYEHLKAGDIVKDLAGRAGVAVGDVVDGIDLPFCALDDRRSAYDHIARLAACSGCFAFVGTDGKLHFVPAGSGELVQTFNYGDDVLALRFADTDPAGTATVVGEGAAGSEGQDAWCWLIDDASAVTGTAGQGDPARARSEPLVRSSSAATQAADAWLALAGMQWSSGTLVVPGAPKVQVGSQIEVAKAPDAGLNGRFVVRSVRHRLDKRGGFTTRIAFSKLQSGGGGGGLLQAIGGLL